MSTTKTAVVILNWNGVGMLQRYLPTLLSNAQGADVVVADNASTDDSMAVLQRDFPTVRRIALDKNWGFADGYNKALQQVDAQYYVLLNSDVEVTANWLQPMQDFMDAHPEVAACQPKIRAMADRTRFEYAGAAGGFIDRYGYPFCRGRVFDSVERDSGQYDDPMPVFWTSGACMMVRADDYHRAGGLDGRFFAHNEEIDLCWRLHLMGRQLYCLPQSVVYHVGGGTLPKNNPMKTYLNFRNNLTMLYKNLPDSQLRGVMRVRWLLDYVAAIQTLVLNGNWADCKAIFRARRDFNRSKHLFAPDRQRIQGGRVVDDVPQRMDFCIVYQYYVRKKKCFADLAKH